jgi:hypothetical protein
MPHWHEIIPYRLKRQDDHTWCFASYSEWESEREDHLPYQALLFRNKDRAVYGIREWLGELVHQKTLRQTATKIVRQRAYREQLISDDPELPKMWKRR